MISHLTGCCFFTGDMDESLLAPPLDESITVKERLNALSRIMSDKSASHSNVIAFDLKVRF